MKKNILIISILLSVLLIGSFLFLLFKTNDYSFIITVKSGEVNVLLKNNEWVRLTEEENIFKYIKAIETKEGEAILSLMKTSIITIEPNTRIDIDDILGDTLTIEQNSGTTWHKFLALSGIKNYDVQTAHTVASVRGTGFFTIVNENSTTFMLGEGELAIKNWNQTLQPWEKVIIYKNETIELQNLTEEEILLLKQMMTEDLGKIKNLRNAVFEANDATITTIQKLTGATKEDFDKMLDDFDNERLTEEEMINQSPIGLPDEVDYVVSLNEKIREQMKIISELDLYPVEDN
jgi:hypothetical protein